MVITREVYKRAVKASNDILEWAIRIYPILRSRNLPKVLGTYVTASAVFRESGYTWYETSGDDAFVLRTTITEKYPMVDFIRSHFLVRRMHSAVTYYAVSERFVEKVGTSTYYLPSIDEIEHLFYSLGRVPNFAPILVLPSGDPVVRKILEVHLHGRPAVESG